MPESAKLDITDDLTRDQLAEIAFDEEVVVSWDGMTKYGIITGYEDGLFVIDPVSGGPDGRSWQELPSASTQRLDRQHFVVWGPANREPEHRRPERAPLYHRGHYVNLGRVPVDERLDRYVDAARELSRVGMSDFCSNSPTFKVRLDIDADQDYERKLRILVRPVMTPMMHDELQVLLEIAERFNLACAISNAGVELGEPDDPMG